MGKITIRVLAARVFAIGLIALLMLTGTAIGEVSRTGLVAEWHFDGDTKDSSGNGNDVNLFNGATFADGKFLKALSFDGVDDYAETSSVIYLNDRSFTFEVWYINPGVNQQANTAIISNYKTGTTATALLHIGGTTGDYVPAGKVQFFIRDSSGNTVQIFSTNRIDNNQWHHIAAVRDTTTGKMYLYIDGVLDTQSDSSSVGAVDSGQKIIIGSGSLDIYTKAIADDVRIYNRALSANEVKANYEAGQIIITSNPSGAEILVDGNSNGIASPTLSVYGVSPGTHTIKCKLSGNSDDEEIITVAASSVTPVTCSPSQLPLLSVSPDPSFNLGTMNAEESASQIFSISNSGSGTLTWSISDDQPWITINPTSGTNSGTVTININTAGLSSGSYIGTITVTSNGGIRKGSVSLNIRATQPTSQPTTPTPTFTASATPTQSIQTVSKIMEDELNKLAPGEILFNPPQEMTVGEKERVEIRIAKTIIEGLDKGLKGRGEPQIENISVSSFMTVELTGDTFEIKPLSKTGQLVQDEGFTQWEYDVVPKESGTQTLQLMVTVIMESPNGKEKPISRPVLEKTIAVKVNPIYTLGIFIESNWEKIIGIIISSGIIGWLIKRRGEPRKKE